MKRYHYFGTIFTILSLIFVLSYEQEPDEPDVRVIVEWNELVINTAAVVDRFQTLRSNRAVPMVQLAIHDALNAIVPVYNQYAYTGSSEDAHPVVAASQAAHDVITELFPNHSEAAAELHQQWLDEVPGGRIQSQWR